MINDNFFYYSSTLRALIRFPTRIMDETTIIEGEGEAAVPVAPEMPPVEAPAAPETETPAAM